MAGALLRGHFLSRVIAPLCAGFLFGCATPSAEREPAVGVPEIVWPSGPETARIRFAAQIRTPADLGIHPSALRRFWDWLSGAIEPRMVRPHGVAVDGRGRLWVADPGAGLVHIFDTARQRYRALNTEESDRLISPIAVTHDADGVAYVTDSARARIRRYDRNGETLGDWTADGALVRPTGIAFDVHNQILWVVDTARHLLVALDTEGKVVTSFGGRGSQPGEFNFPTHLAIDSKSRLLVTDTLNFRVQILSPEGQPLTVLGELGDTPGSFSKPKGVAVDRDGHVYVVDSLFDNVQIFDRTGPVLLGFGASGAGPGQFWLPAGLCVSNGNRIYVADAYNRRVQVFEYLGQ
ncbi:MAG: 6-bladed beta-propeller [bacterium]|nr:6-bladed beta-propeller [bacterium]